MGRKLPIQCFRALRCLSPLTLLCLSQRLLWDEHELERSVFVVLFIRIRASPVPMVCGNLGLGGRPHRQLAAPQSPLELILDTKCNRFPIPRSHMIIYILYERVPAFLCHRSFDSDYRYFSCDGMYLLPLPTLVARISRGHPTGWDQASGLTSTLRWAPTGSLSHRAVVAKPGL